MAMKKTSGTPRIGTLGPRPRVRVSPPATSPRGPAPSAPSARLPAPSPTPARAARTRVTPDLASAITPRRRGEQLIGEIKALDARIESDFYAMGQKLAELSSRAIVRALGCSTFEELLEKHDVPKRAQAYRLIKIVETLPRPLAQRLGSEKSYQSITYAKLAAPRTAPEAFIASNPRIHLEHGGAPEVRLLDATTRQLRAAIDALKNGGTPAPPGLHRATRSLSQLLVHTGIDNHRVTSKAHKGEHFVLIRVPYREAVKLIDAWPKKRKRRP